MVGKLSCPGLWAASRTVGRDDHKACLHPLYPGPDPSQLCLKPPLLDPSTKIARRLPSPSLTGYLEALRYLRGCRTWSEWVRDSRACPWEWVRKGCPCLVVLAVMRMSSGVQNICPHARQPWPGSVSQIVAVGWIWFDTSENLGSGLVPKLGPLRDDWVTKRD